MNPSVDRRNVVIGLSALVSGCNHSPAPTGSQERASEGRPILSESVHCGVASADGRYQATVRLCRYPAAGIAWQWAHVLLDGTFYSFTVHDAECAPAPVSDGEGGARFADAANAFVFERAGPGNRLTGARAHVRCGLRKSASAIHGDGPHTADIRLDFVPAVRHAGLLPGRIEVFGTGNARMTIDGRPVTFSGPAQYHEQVQTDPRFTVPFAYGTLWAGDAGMTLLLTPNGSGGYLAASTHTLDVTGLKVAAPANLRRVDLEYADGTRTRFEARVRADYAIPVYGRNWRGAMVRADFGGRQWVGHINDFRPDEVPYAKLL